MKKIVIFGHSGSGKSTQAKSIRDKEGLAHLDLDTIAWEPTLSPKRMPITKSKCEIDRFIKSNEQLVIEGCYSDLLEIVITDFSEIIYLNLPIDACI